MNHKKNSATVSILIFYWIRSPNKFKLHLSKCHFFVVDLDAPKDLQTVELTDESITLEWKNSRAQVDNYRIKYGPLSGGEHRELLFTSGPKDSTQAKISGTRYQ